MMEIYAIRANDFADEVSRQIFAARKDFYQAGTWTSLLALVAKLHNHTVGKMQAHNHEFVEDIRRMKRKVVIFGAGQNGKRTLSALETRGLGGHVHAFLDNNPQKRDSLFCGKPVISMESVVSHQDEYFVLIPRGKYAAGMVEDLTKAGFGIARTRIVPLEFQLHSTLETRDDVEEILLGKKKHLTIYGMGHIEFLFMFLLQQAGINVEFVLGDDCEGHLFHGVPARSLDTFHPSSSDIVIVVFNGLRKEQLLAKGFAKEQVLQLVDMDLLQYFDKEIVRYRPAEEEVFIDGGSLDLGTSRFFMDWAARSDKKKIYAFEPDAANLALCNKRLEEDKDLRQAVTLVPKGLWSDNTVLTFNAVDVSGASFIAETNCPNVDIHKMSVDKQIQIECTSIDYVLRGGKATFIKMDIEGSELEALKGAAETIRKWHPTLAISVYHKPEDIVSIPAYIKSLVPEYDLYLRCYHEDHTETVLYAIYPRE